MAIDQEREAAALVVVLAVLVPNDGECVTAIADAVETEIRPLALRHERVDNDAAIQLRTQAADAGDDEVVVSGMVVVAAALTVAHKPGTCLLVEILADVGTAAVVLALGVELHLAEEY